MRLSVVLATDWRSMVGEYQRVMHEVFYGKNSECPYRERKYIGGLIVSLKLYLISLCFTLLWKNNNPISIFSQCTSLCNRYPAGSQLLHSGILDKRPFFSPPFPPNPLKPLLSPYFGGGDTDTHAHYPTKGTRSGATLPPFLKYNEYKNKKQLKTESKTKHRPKLKLENFTPGCPHRVFFRWIYSMAI